jgi:hypothetical protein
MASAWQWRLLGHRVIAMWKLGRYWGCRKWPTDCPNGAFDPERKSSKASLDHFAGAYFSFSKIRIARMILPPAVTDQAVTRNVPCTRCQAGSHVLIRALSPA